MFTLCLMHAMVSSSSSTPLEAQNLPEEKLRANELRVEVKAVGVNPVDWKMREFSALGFAQRVLGPSGPFVCGIDFAGVVSEVGSEVADLKSGDLVVGATDFSRGQRGSYASSVTVRRDQVATLPKTVDLVEAACLPVAGVTAHMALFEDGNITHKKNPRVLILGASGGVGHFAVQLAKQHGARVFGACSQRNFAFVESLGAVPLDYAADDFYEQALKRGPFDVTVDAVGSSAYPIKRCKALLKEDGRHVLVMPAPQDYFAIATSLRVKSVFGHPVRKKLEPLVEALAAGKLQVHISARIPLEQAERAHQKSREGRVVGKLVLVR